jgi:hypothetical protein
MTKSQEVLAMFVRKVVVKYRKNAGITKRASCHSLRHTFATYKAEKGGFSVSTAAVARPCEFEHHANLCPFGKTERQKDHGAKQFSMKQVYKRPYPYRFTQPPKALRNATLDNIAIVPASLLPFQQILQEHMSKLPPGAVFLCSIKENMKQRRILERVGELFRQHGHKVRHLPLEQVL